jgi:hypothetical protein
MAPTPVAPTPERGDDAHRRALAIGGAVIALVGVVTAVVLWLVADRRHEATIEEFARAPAGCDTTLAFESDGRYILYLETSGVIEQTTGDCAVSGAFDRIASAPPAFEVAVVGADGDAVALGGQTAISYDIDGFSGSSVGSVQIDTAGEYVIRVASAADDFVVAVGPDPDGGAAMLRLVAISALVAGLIVGGTGLVLAASRGRALRAVPAQQRPIVDSRPAAHGAPPDWWDQTTAPTRSAPPTTEPPRASPATSGPVTTEPVTGPVTTRPRVPGEALHPPVQTQPWGPPAPGGGGRGGGPESAEDQ